MGKLTEEAKKAIGEIRPSLVATASKSGKPIASPRTVANIKENPQVAIICLDTSTRKSCRIWGRGEVLNSGELFDKTTAEFAGRNMTVRNVVKIAVDEVETS
jgi:hypothetical protein